MRRGFNVFPGGGDNPGTLSTPIDRHTLFQSKTFFAFGYEQYVDFQMTMLQLAGGTDRLAYAFGERLGNVITYNSPIQEIRNDGAGVRVVYKGAGGASLEEKSEFCICTIPLDDQRKNEYALLLQPQGATYFCGEHMSYVGSWMAGAFESSHEVIKSLHARASSA